MRLGPLIHLAICSQNPTPAKHSVKKFTLFDLNGQVFYLKNNMNSIPNRFPMSDFLWEGADQDIWNAWQSKTI